VGEKRLKDLEWRLRTAMDHFGGYPLDTIDVALADDFADLKRRERGRIDEAAEAGHPLTEEYTRTPAPGISTAVGAVDCPTARSTRCSQRYAWC
jgi:hypothetical protein